MARDAYLEGRLGMAEIDGVLEWLAGTASGWLLGGPLADPFWESVMTTWSSIWPDFDTWAAAHAA